jgi:hypothetical protein
MKTNITILLSLVWVAADNVCRADTFGSGADNFTIDFVTIGNPGNPAAAGGTPINAGSVPYVYRMGTYEISEQMIDKANALGGLGITKDTRGPDKPATSITWYEAAKFTNWLDTSSGYSPAYKFDASGNYQLWQPFDPGYNPSNPYRNSLAVYVLPCVNEWFESAYYDPVAGAYHQFATGSNTLPLPDCYRVRRHFIAEKNIFRSRRFTRIRSVGTREMKRRFSALHIHAHQKFPVRLAFLQAAGEKFHRLRRVHVVEHAAEDADAAVLFWIEQHLFAARAAARDVD